MSSARAKWAEYFSALAVPVTVVLIVWSAFVIQYRVFVSPPDSTTKYFVTEAKDYYFENSSLLAKESEFSSVGYRDLWLSLPDVDNVITNYEAPEDDVDVLEPEWIHYIIIKGEKINIYSDHLSSSQKLLYENALNEVSAAAWEDVKQNLRTDLVIWAVLLGMSVGCISCRASLDRKACFRKDVQRPASNAEAINQ